VNKEQGHLTIDQIESLLAKSAEELSPERLKSRGDAELHLAQCTACQKVLAMERNVRTRLRDLKAIGAGAGDEHCLSSATLYQLAGGQLMGKDAENALKHIVECDRCATRYRQATTDLDSEPSAEETTLIHSLQTARPDWQAAFGRKLAESDKLREQSHSENVANQPPWRFPRLVWALGAAGVSFCAIWVVTMMWYSSPRYAVSLLADAYSEQRTFELRIAGADYSPLRVTRGSGSSRLDRPRTLLAAEELIGRKLSERPDDSEWLEAKARADLIDGNYEAALKTLDSLPDSPSVLIDRGTAYFERAEITDRPVDFGNAIEALGKVLAKAPDDRIALFNRALVCERILLFSQAIDDWHHYLKVDGKGRWAEEARGHLRQLEQKQKEREKSKGEPLFSPGEFVQVFTEAYHSDQFPGSRFEDYLAVSLNTWLPSTQGRENRESMTDKTSAALIRLAKIAKRDHHDAWLQDLLAGASSSRFRRAVTDLSRAVTANEEADSVAAKHYALEAEDLFRTMTPPNIAGELRAELESMFASKIDQNGEDCLRNAERVESVADRKSYSWLKVQFLLEKGSCHWLVGNLGYARQDYLGAAERAESSNYRVLYLRSQDHLSGIEAEIGNYESAWRISTTALRQFWSGNYADVRGYNLYYNLYELSRLRNQPHLQMAVWRDGVALSESSPDLSERAMAHSLLANSASTIQDMRTAKDELEKAATLFSVSPNTRATRMAQLEAESRRAMMETALGEAGQAVARLRPLEPAIRAFTDPYLSILYYTSLGDAELERGNATGAESALRSAVALSESQLASLKDDEDARVEWSAKSETAYRDLVELELEKGNGEQALTLWESYRGAPLRARGGTTLTPAVSNALPRAPAQTVVYALLPRSLAIWIYSERGSKTFWYRRHRGDVEENVAAFEKTCGNSRTDSAEVIRYGRDLYRALVTPVESSLSWTHGLVIEPDDALAGLAFEALADQDGHYLGEKISITLSLGSYYDRKSREPLTITRSSHALVVAVRNSSAKTVPFLLPLPDAEVEGQVIASKFREARVLTGPLATDETLLAELGDSEVFHFAGHAFSSPKRSGLLLSNSLLRARALAEANLGHLQLVVLSACDSEDGSNRRVTDADSLVRTLLSKRVPHVVASRWDVDSRTTSQFMTLFYDSLLAGEPVSKAIRHAQSALRANPETAHPFYWSAFAAFGGT